MEPRKYRFTFSEGIALFILLLGLPGAVVGISNMAHDGAVILGLTELHWRLWAAGVVLAVAVSVFTGRWQPLFGVPLILLVLIVSGMGGPQDGSSQMEQAFQSIQTLVKYLCIAAPGVVGLLRGIEPAIDKLKAIKQARKES